MTPTQQGREAGETCDCGAAQLREDYCPAHRRRWEYQQDEDNAHAALDKLGAPRHGDPPNDVIYSVAGRISQLPSLAAVQSELEEARAQVERYRFRTPKDNPAPDDCPTCNLSPSNYTAGEYDDLVDQAEERAREWEDSASMARARAEKAESELGEARARIERGQAQHEQLVADLIETTDRLRKAESELDGYRKRLRPALAGYDAQYGRRSLGEQLPDLPQGHCQRIEAVVEAARSALSGAISEADRPE